MVLRPIADNHQKKARQKRANQLKITQKSAKLYLYFFIYISFRPSYNGDEAFLRRHIPPRVAERVALCAITIYFMQL